MKIRVKLTLDEEMLGSLPSNEDLYSDYVATKNPTADGVEEELDMFTEGEKGITIFPRLEDGNPFIYDYQIRGWLKAAFSALSKVGKDGYSGGTACKELKAFKKIVDTQIFVKPRMIPLKNIGENWQNNIHYCERPLRASTPMGERIALAKSETVPAGTELEFTFVSLSGKMKDAIIEALEYGQYHGLGQWRNAGKGAFSYEILSIEP